jgi:CRISPR/Cas system-associated endonuclease Cas1
LVMKQYWRCYGLALKKAQQWFGPRKRSRFVTEFVRGEGGRARGYSAIDAAINYLHQRRLRQAEKINAEVGFPGVCDGFLHRERYNSRRIGLLLDMIDPFKFADREVLFAVVMNGGMSWRDFVLEQDRRGTTFYYPGENGERILNQIGRDADETTVIYGDRQMNLSESYREYAGSLLRHLTEVTSQPTDRIPFTYLA